MKQESNFGEENKMITDSKSVKTIRLPDSLIVAIENLARDDRRNFSQYVQIVLEDHVSKKENEK